MSVEYFEKYKLLVIIINDASLEHRDRIDKLLGLPSNRSRYLGCFEFCLE